MDIKKTGELIKCYGDCIIISDLHIPNHDWGMIDKIVGTGMVYGIKSLIVNGDSWDMIKFSKYGDGVEQSWETLKECSKAVYSKLFTWFDTVVINMGNHDEWLKTITKKQLSMKDFIHLCVEEPPWVELHYTDWDYVILNDEFRICHSKNYSKKAHFVPESIGKKYNKSCIQAHDHMLAYKEVITNNNHRYYINMGGCMDFDKAEYEMGTTTLYGQWAQGFVIIKDGKPRIVTNEELTMERSYMDWANDRLNGYTIKRWERSDR